ncbi:MAG: multidrug effflux MFS transporter [Propionibacteriaceae bacterium]|nr:multidrug effflux MFS transporter [Propionibacteriaceae bacterium]
MGWTPRPVTHFTKTLLVVVSLLAACAPFATDIYLPTFPDMTLDLNTSASGVQLTLMAFLIGAGVGQLFFGPLSDRLGRRMPLIAGTGICVAAGLVSALASSIVIVIIARLVQGLSGAAGMVLSRAIITDVARGAERVRAFNLTTIVLGIAPVAAPVLGAVFADALGWRGLLLIVVGISAVTFVAAFLFVPETHHPVAQGALNDGDSDAASGLGIGSRTYLGNMITFVFGFGAMMAYISASPFVYQNMIGMNSFWYGMAFGATALAITVVSTVAARLSHRFAPRFLLRIGVGILVGSALVLVLCVLLPVPTWTVIGPLFTGVGSMGLIFGNATSLALSAVPQHSVGKASAILGAGQFILGALVAPLVGLGGESTAAPMAIVFAACACVALTAFLVGRSGEAVTPDSAVLK